MKFVRCYNIIYTAIYGYTQSRISVFSMTSGFDAFHRKNNGTFAISRCLSTASRARELCSINVYIRIRIRIVSPLFSIRIYTNNISRRKSTANTTLTIIPTCFHTHYIPKEEEERETSWLKVTTRAFQSWYFKFEYLIRIYIYTKPVTIYIQAWYILKEGTWAVMVLASRRIEKLVGGFFMLEIFVPF